MAANDIILFRKGSYSQWVSANPVLASGEPGYDLTNSILKIGNGVSNWVALSGIGSTSVGGSSGSGVLSGSVTIPELGDPAYNNVSLLLHGEGGSIIDSSANEKIFTISGSATTSTARAKFGSSAILLNSSASITSNSSSDFAFGVGDFTVEFWMNAETLPTIEARLVSFGGSPANQFLNLSYAHSSNTFTVVNEAAAHILTTSQSVSINQWHHVAYTRSGGTVRLFFNGTVLGTTSSDANTPPTVMQISAGNGTIYYDEVRVTKGLARYNSSFSSPTSVFADASSLTLPVTFTGSNNSSIPTNVTNSSNLYLWSNFR